MFDEMWRGLVNQQTTDQVILTGWKDICKACGIKTIGTMRRWAKRYKMPYVRMYGRVAIPRVTLIEWVVNLCKAVADGNSAEDDIIKKCIENLSMRKKYKGNRQEGNKNV